MKVTANLSLEPPSDILTFPGIPHLGCAALIANTPSASWLLPVRSAPSSLRPVPLINLRLSVFSDATEDHVIPLLRI